MLREIVHRENQHILIEEEIEGYFPSKEQNRCPLFKLPGIIQVTAIKDHSISFTAIGFRNFACLDSNTNKLFLNLDTLAAYKGDRLNFIATIGCDIHSQSHNLIDISEHPITIVNGVSYFLLVAKSCQLDILKLLYMLSQSIYINGEQLAQFQVSIEKAVSIQGAWDIRNFLYVVTNKQGFENNSGMQTFADTKDMNQAFSIRESFGDRQVFVSDQLRAYFSETSLYTYKSYSTLDMESIKINIASEYDPYTTRTYLYQSILEACSNLLPSARPLIIAKFQELNSEVLCEELYVQALNNHEVFSMAMVDSFKEHKKLSLQKAMNQILEPFRFWELTWLSRTKAYSNRLNKITQLIKDEFKRLKEIERKKIMDDRLKDLDQILGKVDITEIIGCAKLDNLPIPFEAYSKRIKPKIGELIKTIISSEWRGQNKPISSNNDLLANLQTRIQINQRKKTGLEEAISLAQKQQESLNQLVFAYTSKMQGYEVIDS